MFLDQYRYSCPLFGALAIIAGYGQAGLCSTDFIPSAERHSVICTVRHRVERWCLRRPAPAQVQ